MKEKIKYICVGESDSKKIWNLGDNLGGCNVTITSLQILPYEYDGFFKFIVYLEDNEGDKTSRIYISKNQAVFVEYFEKQEEK